MLWIALATVVLLDGIAALRRRRMYESVEEEPWRASLEEDEPLDLDEIRRAEEEWLEERDTFDDVTDDEWS
jgi:hypothetical protein